MGLAEPSTEKLEHGDERFWIISDRCSSQWQRPKKFLIVYVYTKLYKVVEDRWFFLCVVFPFWPVDPHIKEPRAPLPFQKSAEVRSCEKSSKSKRTKTDKNGQTGWMIRDLNVSQESTWDCHGITLKFCRDVNSQMHALRLEVLPFGRIFQKNAGMRERPWNA